MWKLQLDEFVWGENEIRICRCDVDSDSEQISAEVSLLLPLHSAPFLDEGDRCEFAEGSSAIAAQRQR